MLDYRAKTTENILCPVQVFLDSTVCVLAQDGETRVSVKKKWAVLKYFTYIQAL